MDVTPQGSPGFNEAAAGRQVISSYGNGGFQISGQVYKGPVLVLPGRTLAWTVTEAAHITLETLAPLTGADPAPQILLIGCGTLHIPPPAGLSAVLRDLGVGMEWMATGAACRTFNVLAEEERPVAAALVAVE